ncbi:MAG: thioesterase family protein [Flavobacteriales bacterium]
MYMHETRIRVRYAETDQMGQMYYGRYAELFEVGRVEALRSIGFPYRRIEEQGVLLPVRDLSVRYHRPVRYDDEVVVRTAITALPTARIHFKYELRDESDVLLTEGETTLVFVDSSTKRPCQAPAEIVAALRPYFE